MQQISEFVKGNESNLTNKERLELQAKWFNEEAGNLDELDCPICKNKGYIQKVIYEELYGDYSLTMQHCECWHKRQTIQRARKSGLGEYVNKRFEDFTIQEDWQKDIRSKALEYIKDESKAWWCIVGQSGSGKTLISCTIANYLLIVKNMNVLYITWTDFISSLKRNMMADNAKGVSDYLEYVKGVDVLFIDELLKKFNETDLKYLIEIINYRYTNDLKTIITSEKTISELLDIDEATFSRLIEKSKKYITIIPNDRSKNYRLKEVI